MDCPLCQTGEKFLHFDTLNDRCRLQCGGPVAGKPCGWAADWMTTQQGEALLHVACEALRGTRLILQDMAATYERAQNAT